jgi:proteasome accessory factor B
MAPRKTERILNLTICLLVSGRYLSKSRIREAVEGYHNLSDGAFERTFERDKDELRALGVPIEVGSYDPLFDDEPGYRILASEFELPPIDLDAEEASVVGVAARVWQHASMAESTTSAISKLRAAGIEPDASQLASLEPSVQASEPAFEPLWTAVIQRTRVSFTYRDGDIRTLEPWGMTASKGRWYVIGWDVDRTAERMFKVSRIRDLPKRVSRPGAYAVPDNLDLRALARVLAPSDPTATATLAIRTGKAPTLRRRSSRPEPGPTRAEPGPTRAEPGPTRAEPGPTRAEPVEAQQTLAPSTGSGDVISGSGDVISGSARTTPAEPVEAQQTLAPSTGSGDVTSGSSYQIPPGFDVVDVGYSDIYPLAEEICRHAADVVVLDPPELRAAVIRGLTAVAAQGAA